MFNYTRSRQIDRPQVQDIINNSNIFTNYIELSGDGKVGRDVCIRGGIALYKGLGCVALGNYKGHTPQTMQEANYGMASPHGYRFALRLMQLAERFNMPVVTLVDTVGTHSLIYSLTRLLTHSPNHSLTYSLIYSLTRLLTHSPNHSLAYSLTYSLTH